jgi:hypothetical protein
MQLLSDTYGNPGRCTAGYSTTEKDLAGVMYAFKEWRHYL